MRSGPGELIFPVRLFVSTEQSGRERMSASEIEALGCIEAPNGISYEPGTLGGYATAKCRCRACKQWSADYARDRKRDRTGRSARVWNPDRRRIDQVRHTHASWLIDQGVDLGECSTASGHGDFQATTRYVKILDEEDTKAADVMANLLGDAA
jgi:integrase